MNPVELQPHELMQIVAEFFESRGIAYRVVGSMASMVYGEPRFTNDIDIVAELTVPHVPALCAAFGPPDYYLSETAVLEAIVRRFQFNIIHPASGLKVDIIIPPETEFAKSEARRIRRISSAGEYSVWFGSPEDVLLNKLVYYRLSDGISVKHLRDIAGMMKLLGEQLDRVYITQWASVLGVTSEWDAVCQQVDSSKP